MKMRTAQPNRFDLGPTPQEGWTLREGEGTDGDRVEIHGLDRSDHHAWFVVVNAARAGSVYHRIALERVTAPQRDAIALRFGPLIFAARARAPYQSF